MFFFNNLDFFVSSFVIGLIIEISEFVVVLAYMKSNPNPTPQIIIWIFVLLLHACMLFMTFRLCWKKEIHKAAIIFFSLQSVIFFTLSCTYALPAFLLLLVYPTPVIAIAVYFIAFIFIASVTTSLCILVCKQIIKEERLDKNRVYSYTVVVITVLSLLSIVVASFVATFILVYALVLGQASVLTTGPYAVLSLIPPATITIASWTLKSKVLGGKVQDKDTDSENQEEEPVRSQESPSREGIEDPESHNIIPLVSVNDGPWNYDNYEMNNEQFNQM